MREPHTTISVLRSRLFELAGGCKRVIAEVTQHLWLCNRHGDHSGHLTAALLESLNGFDMCNPCVLSLAVILRLCKSRDHHWLV